MPNWISFLIIFLSEGTKTYRKKDHKKPISSILIGNPFMHLTSPLLSLLVKPIYYHLFDRKHIHVTFNKKLIAFSYQTQLGFNKKILAKEEWKNKKDGDHKWGKLNNMRSAIRKMLGQKRHTLSPQKQLVAKRLNVFRGKSCLYSFAQRRNQFVRPGCPYENATDPGI